LIFIIHKQIFRGVETIVYPSGGFDHSVASPIFSRKKIMSIRNMPHDRKEESEQKFPSGKRGAGYAAETDGSERPFRHPSSERDQKFCRKNEFYCASHKTTAKKTEIVKQCNKTTEQERATAPVAEYFFAKKGASSYK